MSLAVGAQCGDLRPARHAGRHRRRCPERRERQFTAGYTRRRLAPVQQLAGERTSGVRDRRHRARLDLVAPAPAPARNLGRRLHGAECALRGRSRPAVRPARQLEPLDSTRVNASPARCRPSPPIPRPSRRAPACSTRRVSLASRIGAIANGIAGLRSDAESRIGAAVDARERASRRHRKPQSPSRDLTARRPPRRSSTSATGSSTSCRGSWTCRSRTGRAAPSRS